MLIRRTNTRRKERDRRMGIKPRTRAKSSRVERGWCYCWWWWWWWCCCCNSWRGGDGNEVAAGRVKGINSNSIYKAQLSDKVKSLFEADTHPHTHSEPVRWRTKDEGREGSHGNNLIGIKAAEWRGDDRTFETRVVLQFDVCWQFGR